MFEVRNLVSGFGVFEGSNLLFLCGDRSSAVALCEVLEGKEVISGKDLQKL